MLWWIPRAPDRPVRFVLSWRRPSPCERRVWGACPLLLRCTSIPAKPLWTPSSAPTAPRKIRFCSGSRPIAAGVPPPEREVVAASGDGAEPSKLLTRSSGSRDIAALPNVAKPLRCWGAKPQRHVTARPTTSIRSVFDVANPAFFGSPKPLMQAKHGTDCSSRLVSALRASLADFSAFFFSAGFLLLISRAGSCPGSPPAASSSLEDGSSCSISWEPNRDAERGRWPIPTPDKATLERLSLIGILGSLFPFKTKHARAHLDPHTHPSWDPGAFKATARASA
ncbi:hypothetical protein T484DRAFT_3544282, partial [Baffinella frigidus]|mmetsp:Transcript_36562/g.85556  ORF Transcript_36562/g.85556 Transcript_36562/m.85556 type:complete len:281 (+) Transcript_36562:483-1325(+)